MGMLTGSRLLRAQHVHRRSGPARVGRRHTAVANQRVPRAQRRNAHRGAPRAALLLLDDGAERQLAAPGAAPGGPGGPGGAGDEAGHPPTAAVAETAGGGGTRGSLLDTLRALVSTSGKRRRAHHVRQGGSNKRRSGPGRATTRVAAVAIALSVAVLVAARAFATFGTPLVTLTLPTRDAALLLYDRVVGDAWRNSGEEGAAAEDRSPARRYVIAEGDTLGAIAVQYGLSLDSIVSFNGIRDARSLPIGTTLLLPPVSGVRYDVRRGDTLSDIASRFGVRLNTLVDANELASQTIVPGQTLLIPGARLPENTINRVLGRLFVAPARGRISSRYGYRTDPFTGLRRFHNGIDLAGEAGAHISAAMRGTVALVGYNGIYGRYVILRHADGYQSLYAHLQSVSVSRGDSVRQGQRIGTMGNTGYSTGTHLHFSVFHNGEHVDPLPLLD